MNSQNAKRIVLPFLALLVAAVNISRASGQEIPTAHGQNRPQRLSEVPIVPRGFLSNRSTARPFQTLDTLSSETKAAILRSEVHSVPTWLGHFSYGGTTYPYVMVGKPPALGGASRTDVKLIPVRIIFDDVLDNEGHPVVYDPASIVSKIIASPIFESNNYINGFAQYGDAIQRANFPSAPDNWHTLLNRPNLQPPVTVHVSSADEVFFQTPQGIPLAFVNGSYFLQQMFAATQFQTLHVSEFVIWITPNVFLFNGAPQNYFLGFHGASDFNNSGGALNIFTYAFAVWLDPVVADAAFGIPYASDIMFLSHEVAEWMDNPFHVNFVPPWQFPGDPCFAGIHSLEVADPIEIFPDAPFSLISNNFTYHPQNVALLPWFTRESPSSAFGGAYSFPTPLLTSASPLCP